MIRWKFHFENNHLSTDIEEGHEHDSNLCNFMENPGEDKFTFVLIGNEKDLHYINLNNVNSISRTIINKDDKDE